LFHSTWLALHPKPQFIVFDNGGTIKIEFKQMCTAKKEDQIKWKSPIDKELKEMEKRCVWEIIDEKNIPINR
jgi:hypothetical protein